MQACAGARAIRVGYRTEAGFEYDLDVDPWAVVVRRGRWYLLCRAHRADALRAYRIDRVRSVTQLDAPFEPPHDLDPVAVLEEHLADGWEFATEVVVEAAAEKVASWLPTSLGRLHPVDDVTCRLVGTTSNPVWYAEQLSVLPAPFRVVSGPELRAAVRSIAERMLAASR